MTQEINANQHKDSQSQQVTPQSVVSTPKCLLGSEKAMGPKRTEKMKNSPA